MQNFDEDTTHLAMQKCIEKSFQFANFKKHHDATQFTTTTTTTDHKLDANYKSSKFGLVSSLLNVTSWDIIAIATSTNNRMTLSDFFEGRQLLLSLRFFRVIEWRCKNVLYRLGFRFRSRLCNCIIFLMVASLSW